MEDNEIDISFCNTYAIDDLASVEELEIQKIEDHVYLAQLCNSLLQGNIRSIVNY